MVWFRPGYGTRDGQPFNAQIVFVHGDRMVNIAFHDHEGRPYSALKVQLVQEGDEVPSHGRYVQWMPYQQAQAKKSAEKIYDNAAKAWVDR